MQDNQEKIILKTHQIKGIDGQIISFGDTKVIEKNGEEIEIAMFIPQCCREGWSSCPHVLKKQRPVKNNIGL